MIIYDYLGRRGAAVAKKIRGEAKGEIRKWRDGLPIPQRGQLDEKLNTLADTSDLTLLPGLIAGPIKYCPHIYKLQVGGKVRLRPLLCRGPFNAEEELTLLVPATERDHVLDPPGVLDTAKRRREEVMENEDYRAKYVFPPE